MSNKKEIKNVQLLNPYDTEENWASSTRILGRGEIAFSSDKNNIYKVGDGEHTWSELDYSNQGPQGEQGIQGISIASIKTTQSTVDGGENLVQVIMSNEQTHSFSVRNGSKGADGNDGEDGVRGTRWTVGTGITGTSTTATIYTGTNITDSLVGDMYLNKSTGYIYKCTVAGAANVAKWIYVGSIKGATGATGSFASYATAKLGTTYFTNTNHIIRKYTGDSEFPTQDGQLEVCVYDPTSTHSDSFIFSHCRSSFYTNNSADLGSSSKKWGQIYSTKSSISTSDKHKKTDFGILDKNYINLFDSLEIVKYKHIDESRRSTLTSEEPKRYHIGVLSQDVEEVVKNIGMTENDFAGVISNFFAQYGETKGTICAGWMQPAEDSQYSQNTIDFRDSTTDDDYVFYNELIERKVSLMDIDDYRKNIKYIIIEDNSKLVLKQPDVILNGISCVDSNGNTTPLEFSGNYIQYYETDDETFENPLSSASFNSDGTITCCFDKMYGQIMLELTESIDITEFESVIVDADFVSEYKVYFIPDGVYQNANVWDRNRNDQIIYDYMFRYGELHNLHMFVTQETRKELKETQQKLLEAESTISEMESRIVKLEEALQTLTTQ